MKLKQNAHKFFGQAFMCCVCVVVCCMGVCLCVCD